MKYQEFANSKIEEINQNLNSIFKFFDFKMNYLFDEFY